MVDWLNKTYTLVIADIVEFFRIPLAVLSTILTPLAMVLSFGLGMKHGSIIDETPYFLFLFPGILSLGTMFSCTFSTGYTIINDRQRRIISDIVLSPISYSSFVIARIVGSLIKSVIQFLLILIIGILFSQSLPSNLLLLFIAFLLTGIIFSAIGMIFGVFTNILTFSGFANIVLMPAMFFSGIFFPISYYKRFAPIIQLLPFTLSVDIFRSSFISDYSVDLSLFIILLIIYAICFVSIGILLFKKAAIRR